MQSTFVSLPGRVIPAGLLYLALLACTGEEETGAAAESSVVEVPGTVVNQLTPEEETAGWRLLFDGRTFDGWRGLGRDTVPTAHWTIQDGAIYKRPSGEVPLAADGQPMEGGDLMTAQAYGDYELAWEWKISPGGNSGVKYNVSEAMSTATPPRNAALGFEYQVIDDIGHPDSLQPSHQAAGLYDLIPASQDKPLRPAGEWNQSRIVFQGNHGEHWLNGAKVVEYDLGTPRMDSLVAASKYSDIEGFAARRQGHIVLQDHNDAVWYRNLKIRELQ